MKGTSNSTSSTPGTHQEVPPPVDLGARRATKGGKEDGVAERHPRSGSGQEGGRSRFREEGYINQKKSAGHLEPCQRVEGGFVAVRGHRGTKEIRYPRRHAGKSSKGEAEVGQNTLTLKVKGKREKERENENPPKDVREGARALRRDGEGKEHRKVNARTQPAVDLGETKQPKGRMKNNARKESVRSWPPTASSQQWTNLEENWRSQKQWR